MNAFSWGTSDDRISLDASGRTQRGAVVGLSAIDVHARILMLSKLGKGSAETADLVVKVSLG